MGHNPDVVAGAPILAAWHNTIRDRTVEPFTNAAERTAQWVTPPEGALSYLRDVDTVEGYNGTVWVPLGNAGVAGTYTPVLTQSGAVAKTVDYAKYVRHGPFVTLLVGLTLTGGGTTNNTITVSLPVTATSTGMNLAILGAGLMRLVAGGNYPLLVQYQSTTTVSFLRTDIQPANVFGIDPNFALAAAQSLQFACTYEAA